jgi:signal transduction histidine kinase
MNKFKLILKSLINIGTESLQDTDSKKRVVVGVNLMTISLIVLDLAVGLPVYFIARKGGILLGIFLEISLLFGTLLFNYYKKYYFASLSIYLIMSAATLYFGFFFGKVVESQLMIAYLIGVALFMFPDRATKVFCIAISIFILFLIEKNNEFGYIKSFDASLAVKGIVRWASYLAIITLIILTYVLYSRNSKALQTQLKENLKKEEIKNHDKSTFISNAYHEVRGAFFGVFVLIQALDRVEKKEDFKRMKFVVNNLRSACQYLKLLLNNILEYSKFEAGILNNILLEPVELRMVLGELVEIGRYTAIEKHVKIFFYVSDDIPEFIACDRMKLTQIFTNLLHNAIKFCDRDTSIKINIGMGNTYWNITFEDQGKGICEDKLEKIFEPFITEKRYGNNGEGIGLGLPITRKLVELQNGKIVVDSQLGKGSCFSVSFPHHLQLETNNALINHQIEALI